MQRRRLPSEFHSGLAVVASRLCASVGPRALARSLQRPLMMREGKSVEARIPPDSMWSGFAQWMLVWIRSVAEIGL